MSTPEKDYFDTLDEAQQEELRTIISTWRGLGIVGCEGCEVPTCTKPAIDGKEDAFITGVGLNQLIHYTIELNGLKRPVDSGMRVDRQRPDEFNEEVLFHVAMRLGLTEESFEALSSAFQSCITCPSALAYVGETPSFQEAIAILEAGQHGSTPTP